MPMRTAHPELVEGSARPEQRAPTVLEPQLARATGAGSDLQGARDCLVERRSPTGCPRWRKRGAQVLACRRDQVRMIGRLVVPQADAQDVVLCLGSPEQPRGWFEAFGCRQAPR